MGYEIVIATTLAADDAHNIPSEVSPYTDSAFNTSYRGMKIPTCTNAKSVAPNPL